MALFFTNHAKDRMKERNITEKEVKECLNSYQTSYPDDDDADKTDYVYMSPNGKRIRVVIKEKGTHKIVISVMD